MRVEFENSPGDFFRYMRTLPRAQRLQQFGRTLLVLAMISLPGFLTLAIAGTPQGMLVAGIWVLVFVFLFWLMRRKAERRMVATMQRMALELKPDCLRAEIAHGWTERDWSLVKRVHESADCMLVLVSEGNFYPVPKSAFTSPAESERFAAELKRLIAAGASSAAPMLKPTVPDVTPIQQAGGAAAQVSFVTTPEQLYDANQHAASKNTKPITNGGAMRSAALMAGIGIGVLYLEYDGQPSLLTQVLAFTLLVLASVVLLRVWMRTRSERNVDPILFGPRTLTLTPAGLWWTGPAWQSFSNWENIGRAIRLGEMLVVYSNHPSAVAAIPLTAFESEGEADAFLETITMFQGMNQHRNEPQHLPMVTVVSDNPYQPPSTM